ncbi:acyl-CoA thioesterase [Neisseria subflava]|uniref:Acyl-CoA thioesterase n=1 Tax=Neisseria subflava TaxID=28449 RepID=A0A9X9N7E1_NEISU|nr:acyl-CoA thioesterase [Neisseria subflava]
MVRHPTLYRDYRPRTRTNRTRRVPTHQSQLMKLTVRNYHLDGYGHVNNARYLEFLEEARWTFFQEHDLLSELEGIMLVVARVDIRYRRPSLEGDVLTFTGRLKDIGTRHIILSQTATLPNGKAAIEAEVTLMPVSSESGRSISVPQP